MTTHMPSTPSPKHSAPERRAAPPHRLSDRKAFTLVEILVALGIGVLIVGVLIANYAGAFQTATYKNVPQAMGEIDTGLVQFVQQTGGNPYPPITLSATATNIPTSGTLCSAATAAALSNAATIDNVLVTAGFTKSVTATKFGTEGAPTGAVPLLWNTTSQTFYCNPDAAPSASYAAVGRTVCQLSTANVPGTDGTNFYLDNSTIGIPLNTRVVCHIFPNVPGTQAAALANLVNNNTLATATTANTQGKVAYAVPNAAGLTTVYYYIDKF